MFHSGGASASGYPDSSSAGFHQHLQQPPVYVPSSRAVPGQYSSPAAGHFPGTPHQATAWSHAADPASYVGGGSHSLATTNPHTASALSAGQFYAQNMMMTSWRAYDGTGFQRTSPYGKNFIIL